MLFFWIMLGGAVGAGLRYAISGYFYTLLGQSFAWGTLGVNLIGSFLIGLCSGFFSYLSIGPSIRAFILIGLLGGFTTFSSFSLETINLFRDGEFVVAIINILANNLVGILLCLLGVIGSEYIFELVRRLA